MSKDIAVQIEDLSKTYKLYASRRDRIFEFFNPFGKVYHRKFHALKNLSLDVEKGEFIGIIGKNGSGKSTLLKILSSIVTSTSGTFSINGRVTALLELGGGFNMELSGVENVLFVGAIHGYSKKEMIKRLPDILEFADIGEYAYQPVKNYSSGMYVRLAFSMNINIDPDILIVDEALSVGDVRFQQKCFRKIKEIKESGKTIIMCTHSMGAVNEFCNRAVWINKGEIIETGLPQLVTEKYQTYMANNKSGELSSVGKEVIDSRGISASGNLRELKWQDMKDVQSFGNRKAIISHAAIFDADNNLPLSNFKGGEMVKLAMIVEAKQTIVRPRIQLVLNGKFSNEILKIYSEQYDGGGLEFNTTKETIVVFTFRFPSLGNGNYTFSLNLTERVNEQLEYLHRIHDALVVNVRNPDPRHRLGAHLVLHDVQIACGQLLEQLNNKL